MTTQDRSFSYDGRGFLTSETHPELGTAVSYSMYDSLGNPGRILRGGWDLRYAYDAAGRLVEIKEAGSQCTDPATKGCWKQWTYATGNFQAGHYSNGKLAIMKRHNWVLQPPNDLGVRSDFDAWVEEHYRYDADDGAISHVQTVLGTGDPAGFGGETDNTRPVFEYGIERNPLGDVASRSYPNCTHRYCLNVTSPRTVSQSFSEGFLTSIGDFAPSIQYHPNGMVSQIEHGNGVRWSQAADPTGMARPYRIRTNGASDDLNTGIFEYDGAGNIVRTGADRYLYDQVSRVKKAELGQYPVPCAKSRTVSGSDNTAATYDSCGTMDVGPYTIGSSGKVTLRAEGTIAFHDGFSVEAGGTLAAESGAVVDVSPAGPAQRTQGYEYDRFGNLTASTTDGIGQLLKTDAATNHKTGADIVYDASGNLISQPITQGAPWQYKYDPFNMLWDVTRPEGGGWINVYGPGDERIWVVDWTAGSSLANWHETYTLRDLDGAPLRRYTVDGGNGLDHWQLTRDYVWRGNTLLAAIRNPGTNEKTVYFHPDHLGSPRILTDAAGSTIETHVYFPFGQKAYTSNKDDEVLHFTGHERDNYAGGDTVDLDYMHARYFSAHLGRFTSPDPVGGSSVRWPQSWNRYTYVQANPLKFVDPTGEVVNLAGLKDDDLVNLLKDLSDVTGNTYGVDEDKNLILVSVGEDSSTKATKFLNDLIGAEEVYNVSSADNRPDVLFGNHPNGTREIRIDFADFGHLDYGKVAPAAFNTATVFLHEAAHAALGLKDPPLGRRSREVGPTVEFVNQIREERGLPIRGPAYLGARLGFFDKRRGINFLGVIPRHPRRIFYVEFPSKLVPK